MEVAAGAMSPLLHKLGKLLADEFNLDKRAKKGVKSLEMELALMHASLVKVGEVPPDQLDMEIRIWAGKVRDMSTNMENAVDDFMARMDQEGRDGEPTNMKNRVKKFLKKTAKLFTRDKTLHQISNAIQEAQDLAKDLAEVHNRYKLEKHSISMVENIDLRLIDMYKDVTQLVGIEETMDELIQMLTDVDEESKLQLKTLSIVGFGGLGKTTLAKVVYDRIKVKFDCGAFVSVSRTPDMKKVLKDVMYELDKAKFKDIHYTRRDENLLIHELRDFLEDKRYIIVFDDLWDEKVWDTISWSLPRNGYGSRLLTTTRVNNIAEKCCSGQKDLIYEIMPLGYQISKRLFLKILFGSEDSCHDALTEVDEILKICGGMPLAITCIASSLCMEKPKYQEMIKFLHSARWGLPMMRRLTTILSYSYFDLPSTLKACLLYLAASAKNQRIQKDNLVRKWIAEGLIPEYKDHSREEVASQYFHELINRNVIQPVEYGNCTYEVNYMMLCTLRLIAREQNFATILSNFDTSEAYVDVMPIRLFIQGSDSERSTGIERMNLTNARSITTLGPAKSVSLKYLGYVRVLDLDGSEDLDNSAMDDICRMILLTYLSLKQTKVTEIPPQISDLRYLKTLAVRNTPITTLPPQIGELQNLETLDVRRTQISNLPPEIRKLQNLKTLDVRQTQVKELPKEVIHLPKLEHLHFGQSGSLGVKLPMGSDQLKSVKVMGTVDSRVFSASAMKEISELIKVRELEVVLYDGPADRDQNEELLSCVGKCSNLQSLTIYGDSNPSYKLPPAPPNFPLLEMLKVAGRFVEVPQWIALLRNLKKLDIRVCILEPNHLGILAELPLLSSLALALVALPREQVAITGSTAGFERLEVFNFNSRVPWITFEQGAMPSLTHLDLKLYACSPGKFPSGIMYLHSLKKIILRHSSQYASSVGVTQTVAVMKKEAASHANLIELTINGNREIFPSNTSVNTSITGTEIEE